MFSKNFNGEEETENLIVDTILGDEKDTIVIGAHADGVDAGHGINDNGSGTSSILEIALQMFLKGVRPLNKVRFAWWAAEEIGLLGSIHYVQSLNPEQIKKIVLNLNFDMLGSPNYLRGIYYGAAASVDPRIRTASGNIQKVLESHFKSVGLQYDLTEFNGRSDYGPFIEKFIPAGGLAAGAEGIKTPEQRERSGGVAGIAYDPCYHQKCDSLANVHPLAIHEFSQNAANAVQFFSVQRSIREYLQRPLSPELKNLELAKLGQKERILMR